MTSLFGLHLDVVFSALLATAGGFFATRVNAALEGRRRQVGAALLCGEVLSAMERLIRLAANRHAESAALCPVTIRLLQAARREIDLYERNREQMFSLLDPDLRARTHSFMVKVSIPLDHLFEDYKQVNAGNSTGEAYERLTSQLETAFASLSETRQEIPALLQKLGPLARDKFQGYSKIDVTGVPAPARSSILNRVVGLGLGRHRRDTTGVVSAEVDHQAS
jgi:hypothetical protein